MDKQVNSNKNGVFNFEVIANIMNEGVLITDKYSKITYSNNKITELTGYSSNYLKGRNYINLLVHKTDLPFIKEKIKKRKNGNTDNYELKLNNKSGKALWVNCNVSPIICPQDGYVGTISLLTDITTKKEIEKQLKEKADVLYSLFEESPIANIEVDFSGSKLYLDSLKAKHNFHTTSFFLSSNTDYLKRCISKAKIIRVNRSSLSLFKYKTKKELSNTFLKKINTNMLFNMALMFDMFDKGESKYSNSLNTTSAENSLIYADFMAVIIKNYEADWSKVLLSFIDIGQKITSIEQSIKNTMKYFSLFNESPIGLCEVDISRIIKNKKLYKKISNNEITPELFTDIFNSIKLVNVNKTLLEITGYDSINSLKNNLHFIFTHELQKSFTYTISNILSGREFDTSETNLCAKDGSIVYIYLKMYIPDEYKKTYERIFISITDATDFIKTKIELEDKNKELDTFLYRTSHDLRSPLASIEGLINIMKNEAYNKDNYNSYINLIEKSTNKMSGLLHDILNITRISRSELIYSKINVSELINELISEFRFNSNNVSVICDISDNISVMSDKSLLISIFQNLIGNAIKYKDYKKKNPFVKINVSVAENDEISVIIEDNGVGMENEIKEKIFDMFYRGSETSTGYGLGLYIVKTNLSKLNGKITCNSIIGKGTTFEIILPSNRS